MCTETIQTYSRCGCRTIKTHICRNHINNTHAQLNNKPCPQFRTEILNPIRGSRVGTRNHPGPCPRISTTWSFQSVKEAKREEMRKAAEKENGGLWSAGRDGVQFDGVGFVGGDGNGNGSGSTGARSCHGPRSGVAGSRVGMSNNASKRKEKKKWLWQGVFPNDRVAMDVAFGGTASVGAGHGEDQDMGTDYYSQVERDLKTPGDIDAEIEENWRRENWKPAGIEKGKGKGKMISSVEDIEQPPLDWRMDHGVKMENEEVRMGDQEILDRATQAGNYWKRRKY